MKYNKPFQLIISLSFLIMLSAPHFVEFSRGGADTTSVEKRAMAGMPHPRLMLQSFSDFAGRFDKYYNDAFGLRDTLIRWNNRFRLYVFGESPVAGVRVGRDGWLFYANEWVLEDYENVMPYSQQDLAKMRRITEERRLWLERRGIEFFILIAPNKHTVYSEYLPSRIRKIGKESRLDQVSDLFKSYPEIEFIDLREALARAKSSRRLYHRTDTHWNDYGAFIGYSELMERISRYFPNVRRLSLGDFRVSVADKEGGDLAKMLSLSDLIREEQISLVPKFTPRARDGVRSYPDPVDKAQYPDRGMIIKETNDPKLPKALIFRDSYSWPLIPFLAESFRSSVFLWDFDFHPEIIEKEKPDLVIFECVERYLSALYRENPESVISDFRLLSWQPVEKTAGK